MEKIKIHIKFDIKNGPWGGGNQFLKSLKKQLKFAGNYSESILEADVVLINSHHIFNGFNILHWYEEFHQLKNKIIIHRIDGPIFSIRDRDLFLDKFIFFFNRKFATGTVFQSDWSREKCFSLGMSAPLISKTIINASDKEFFKTNQNKTNTKTRIIASSWSSNMNKGFAYYKYLDETLDFSKYEMVFAGNSPFKFKNIKLVGVLSSNELMLELKKSDIYLTASKNDPCSNALIEAISAGLPCICLNSGGHPQVLKDGGELFINYEELIYKIQKVADNLDDYIAKLPSYSIEKAMDEYLEFSKFVLSSESLKKQRYYFSFLLLSLMWLRFKIMDKVNSIANRLLKLFRK